MFNLNKTELTHIDKLFYHNSNPMLNCMNKNYHNLSHSKLNYSRIDCQDMYSTKNKSHYH
ncbi:hypothetical protein BpHYR1_020336 [Brachionus plicatilis]|uniref:Uncharacterized protein n=1 Tax=Brachionus plicatilis TaxID=10195 RepID=A0A3M7Q0Q9_BRAPC|nr:hypothetical protein BpHYR1_020336 [Brachionus plicatilis]